MADLKRENPPDRYVSPKLLPAGPVTGHPDLLRKADLLLTSAVQKGEALRKEFDKDIDQEWNFGDILKILKKDALNILKKPFKTSS
ncbi:MAG: hypothetical protein HY913_04345 [Desulfomonile tiedjei]|nr:hypothetical protein [Desulfomonile tiedjei]